MNFVVGLIVRRPESMNMLVDKAPDTLREQMQVEGDRMIADQIIPGNPLLEKFAQSHYPGLVENSGRLLAPEIVENGPWREALAKREWWVWNFGSVVGYTGSQVTSDRLPVCLGLAYSDPNSLILLPLSPTKVLCITSKERRKELRKAGIGRLSLEVIKAVATCSQRFVFGDGEVNTNVVERILKAKPQPLADVE